MLSAESYSLCSALLLTEAHRALVKISLLCRLLGAIWDISITRYAFASLDREGRQLSIRVHSMVFIIRRKTTKHSLFAQVDKMEHVHGVI